LDECIPDSDQIIRNIKQLARTSNGRARLFIVMVRTGSLALHSLPRVLARGLF
jgi:hypothetical protein